MLRFFRTTRGEERHLLDSSFEPHGDGYAFYRHHLARGIPVSAAEREAYLRPPFGGSRRDFYEAIRGREASLPRRGWWRSQHATLSAIPVQIGLGLVLVGAMLIWRSGGFDEPPLRWLLLVAGGMAVAYGILVLLSRTVPRRPDSGRHGRASP